LKEKIIIDSKKKKKQFDGWCIEAVRTHVGPLDVILLSCAFQWYWWCCCH